MNAEQLAMVSGVVLSLGFSYIPGLKGWFEKFEGDQKRLGMLIVLLLTSLGIFGLACTGRFDLGVVCSVDGAMDLVEILIVAAVANQAAFQLTPKE